MTSVLVIAAAAWVAGIAVLFGLLQQRALARLWREPVLRDPVLIIESDDWGPGLSSDAGALEELAQILERHRDCLGRSALMTLGLLLSVADTARIRQAGALEYFAASFADAGFVPILAAIRKGMAAGVFSPQLHGMEHYWPAAVMKAAEREKTIRAWVTQDGVPRHEDLPPALQSRWIDGAQLPSRTLPEGEAAEAAKAEVRVFRELFEIREVVVVPPTFVWTEAAELGWAEAGARVVVTHGARYCASDAQGRLVAADRRLYNGQRPASGVMYLVRDEYFEPALGHRAERAIAALEAKAALGRPMLLEMHRFNFTGSAAQRQDALQETERLLRGALQRLPRLRFMSTAELAQAIARRDGELVEKRFAPRIRACLAKAAQVPELKKLAWLSGAIVPAWALYRASRYMSRLSAGAA